MAVVANLLLLAGVVLSGLMGRWQRRTPAIQRNPLPTRRVDVADRPLPAPDVEPPAARAPPTGWAFGGRLAPQAVPVSTRVYRRRSFAENDKP